VKQHHLIRLTKQRRLVLDELRKMHTHPTADELYQHVRKLMPRISLGTVYRNLELLSRSGLIRKLELGGSQMHFDGHLGRHSHIRCVCCGRVDDIDIDRKATACDAELLERTGYTSIERRVDFTGVCPACRGRECGTESE
jgi:Fur family ferric uptake transcriptional regulator